MRHVVIAVVIALTSAARADDRGADEAAALEHIDRGVAAFHAREYTRAHREFAAARELVPERANPYRWLALTEMQLGDCASAVPNIAEFERRVPAADPRLAELIRLRVLCEREREQRATPPPPTEREPSPPITRRAWFWGAIAGTALVAGGAVLFLTLSGDDVARLPPVQCGDAGCTP